MALRSGGRIDIHQAVTIDVATPSISKQFFPSPRSSRPKLHWLTAKKVLHSSKNDDFVAIRFPDYCPSHTPLHPSFTSEDSLSLLLHDVSQRDMELQECLEERPTASGDAVMDIKNESFDRGDEELDKFDEESEGTSEQKRIPEELKHFQDFVNQFLSLFLQSDFSHCLKGLSKRLDSDKIIQHLAKTQSCPDVKLFCRVAMDPNLVAGDIPETNNLGYTDNGVPLNQLARFLDIAVLQFLSTVNEHTDTHALVWVLDYLNNLLLSLITSMNLLNSFGWYGAPHIRIRKGTTPMGRPSIMYPLHPPIIVNPSLPVVVVEATPPNTPPSNPGMNPLASNTVEKTRDPVTGQHSTSISPLTLSSVTSTGSEPDLTMSFTADQLRKGLESFDHDKVSPAENTVPGGAGRKSRTRRTSRQELNGIMKVASSPQLHAGSRGDTRSPTSSSISAHEGPRPTPSPQSPARVVSTISQSPPTLTSGLSSTSPATYALGASSRKRKLTPAGPPPGYIPGRSSPYGSRTRRGTESMNIIQEEKEKEEPDGVDMDGLGRTEQGRCDVPGGGNNVHNSTVLDTNDLSERHGLHPPGKNIHGHWDQQINLSPQKRETCSPSCATSAANMSTISDESERGKESSSTNLIHTHNDGNNHIQRLSSSSLSSHASSRTSLVSDTFSDGRSRSNSTISPPAPKHLAKVDIEHELSTFTNGEGRISLLAILNAVAKLPECNALWNEEVGEKCFSLIQHCIDIGLPQKDDTQPSSKAKSAATTSTPQERKKRLVKQDKTTEFVTVPEKPWIVHGRFIAQFSVKALIQCSTCSLVGCSTDTSFCRLRQFDVSSSAQKSSMHNKLIRILKRINLHSPAIFRQAVIDFAHPSMSSCHKVFQFLHVVLQYCSHGTGEVHCNPLLDAVVVGVLGVVVDRLASLDVCEISIQEVSGVEWHFNLLIALSQ